MRRVLVMILAVAVLLVAFPSTDAAARPVDPTGYQLELMFDELPQATVGLVQVRGRDVQGARARFLSQLVEFYPVGDDEWYGMITTNMEQTVGTFPLQVLVWFGNGRRDTWNGEVEVVNGGFITEDITISADLGYLLEPETDRAERVRLQTIFAQVTPTHHWSGTFQRPTPGDFTSPFGTHRLYNEVFWGRHTGIDLRGPMGTPILASGAGRVALAERLDIRGNHVIIDHGWGIYTGYSHLSEMHVTRGQYVQQGQILGLSGNTGRSSGPHIHWEVAVSGEWVDPARFLELQLP